jgi:hypothetical protein
VPEKRNGRILQTRSLIFSLICGVLLASALGAPAIQSEEQQARIEVFHVPELDAGFHLLCQLKLAEARAQFPAHNLPNSSRNSPKTRSLPASWPN